MPEPLWIYLMALLYFSNVTTCSAIADAFDSVSHDRLTRMLQGTWSGHTLLDLALRLLFTVAGGYLIVDDTVVAKPYAVLWCFPECEIALISTSCVYMSMSQNVGKSVKPCARPLRFPWTSLM